MIFSKTLLIILTKNSHTGKNDVVDFAKKETLESGIHTISRQKSIGALKLVIL